MNKTTVLFHSADADGWFCREIARKFLPDAELIGWNFGDDPLQVPSEGIVYILDLPVDRVFGCNYAKVGLNDKHFTDDAFNRFIWLDHHASSIASHPKTIPGYRIDGVAACRLAWQWFSETANSRSIHPDYDHLPSKQDFIDRKVSEPLAVRLAGEYDIWDKRDPDAELFQHGLRSRELSENLWDILLVLPETDATTGKQDIGTIAVHGLLDSGEAIQYAKTRENESIIKHCGFTVQFEGLTFLACNAARYNSHLFTAGLKPEHDACLGFNWDGKQWRVSLYHAPGKEHHDLSKIAVKYSGGGHKGACGFQCASIPFLWQTANDPVRAVHG